jgi:hypothetical protein
LSAHLWNSFFSFFFLFFFSFNRVEFIRLINKKVYKLPKDKMKIYILPRQSWKLSQDHWQLAREFHRNPKIQLFVSPLLSSQFVQKCVMQMDAWSAINPKTVKYRRNITLYMQERTEIYMHKIFYLAHLKT